MAGNCQTYDELIGVTDMLKKRVKRYVDRVVSYLPILERRKARVIITESIYARLDDLTSGMKPTRHDLHMVLREMGSPESLADAYYDDFHRPIWEKVDLWKFLHRFIHLLTILALVLVSIGMIELVMGAGNMQRMVVGLVLGMIVVFYQMLVQMRTSILADGR